MTRLSTSPGPYHDRGQIDRHQAAAHVAKLERTERTIDDVIHDEYLRDPYNAAFSSISILYGVVRILRMLSTMPASEERAGLGDRSPNSRARDVLFDGHPPYPAQFQTAKSTR